MNFLDMLREQMGFAPAQQAPQAGPPNPYQNQLAMQQAQQQLARAQELQNAQFQGTGSKGWLSVLAPLLGQLKGQQLERRANESLSQAVRRQYEIDAAAQAQAANAKRLEEARQFKRDLAKIERTEAAKAKYRQPAGPDIRTVNDQIVAIGPDGKAQVIYSAPQRPDTRQPTLDEIKWAMLTPEEQAQAARAGLKPQQPAPPTGYSYKADGTLQPIQGGPADPAMQKIPADQAARKAMTDIFLADAPGIAKAIQSGEMTGPIDATIAASGYGKGGEIKRQIQSGVDALRRNLTGAGMSASEADEYVGRYLPSRFDTAASLQSKVGQLQKELQGYTNVLSGKSANVGRVIEVNGKRYRVVGGDPNDPDVEEIQ